MFELNDREYWARHIELANETVGRLTSGKGRRAFKRVLKASEGKEHLTSEQALELFEGLSESDHQTISRFCAIEGKLADQHIAYSKGQIALGEQMMSIIARANELEPTDKERTTGEAVEVLKRHGENPGVSDEVMDLEIEVEPISSAGESVTVVEAIDQFSRDQKLIVAMRIMVPPEADERVGVDIYDWIQQTAMMSKAEAREIADEFRQDLSKKEEKQMIRALNDVVKEHLRTLQEEG